MLSYPDDPDKPYACRAKRCGCRPASSSDFGCSLFPRRVLCSWESIHGSVHRGTVPMAAALTRCIGTLQLPHGACQLAPELARPEAEPLPAANARQPLSALPGANARQTTDDSSCWTEYLVNKCGGLLNFDKGRRGGNGKRLGI